MCCAACPPTRSSHPGRFLGKPWRRRIALGPAQPWSEIERLTYPVGERLLYLVSVNNLEQVAIPGFLGGAMHGSEPFDFTRKENPYFEKCLPRPYKEITDLPCKHDRKGRSVDALRTEACGKVAKLLPCIAKILIKSVNQRCLGEDLSILRLQMKSDRAFYIRGCVLRLRGSRFFRRGFGVFGWGFGLFRSLRFVEAFFSRAQCSCPPGLARPTT
jgi:hypothetical protein